MSKETMKPPVHGSAEDLVAGLLAGDRRSLGKAITMVESGLAADRQAADDLLAKVISKSGKSFRLGISGAPGVGKSTFIEAFGELLVKKGRRIAVLAVDPSSPVSGGSLMGDKTRMENLAKLEAVFVRPSPSRGVAGGVARRTREATILCEAAGYDTVIIETVGVGQSEVSVAGMVDAFMVLQLPYAGDELQGIKKGIMELADLVCVTKADGEALPAAKRTQADLQNALALVGAAHDRATRVFLTSALQRHGLSEVCDHLEKQRAAAQQSGAFRSRRQEQNMIWFRDELHESLREHILQTASVAKQYAAMAKQVAEDAVPASVAARRLLHEIFPG